MLLAAIVLAAMPTVAQEAAVSAEFDAAQEFATPPGTTRWSVTDYALPANPPATNDSTGHLHMLMSMGTCSAPITTVGRVISARAVLTPEKKYVYTIYEFQVEEQLRGRVDSVIYLVRPTGKVTTPQGTYATASDNHVPFEVDARYLVFLTPKNGFYYTSGHDWRIQDRSLVSAHSKDLEAFPMVQALSAARESVCAQ